MAPETGSDYIGPLTTSGHAEIREELIPYLALGWAPATTSEDKALCAMHALTEALNAHRIMNESLDPEVIHLSFEEIHQKFMSEEYRKRATDIANQFSRTPANPGGDPALRDSTLTEYLERNWLDQQQLGLLLEIINTDLKSNYRLGVITASQSHATDEGEMVQDPPTAYLYPRPAGGGPVIWLYSYGHGTHWEAMVPDQPLTERKKCDYKQWGFEGKAAEIVEAGLFRVTTRVEQVNKEDATAAVPRQMALEPGQFVTRQEVPEGENWIPPSDQWFWGELPSLRLLGPDGLQAENVPLQERMGPVHMSTVSKVKAVVPQGHKSGRKFPKSGLQLGSNLPRNGQGSEKKSKKKQLPTPDRTPTPKKSFRPSKSKDKEEIKRGTKKMKREKKKKPPPPSSSSSEEEPGWKTGNADPTRRQPSYSDGPGTLRMYFASTPQPIDDPTSRLLSCAQNQLLLKVDHEELEFPRMREIDLIEGYVAADNLERIRRPWGIHNIMPTRGHPDYDSKRYSELKVIAKKRGVPPGISTKACKMNILTDKREKDMENATDRQDLEIYELLATYRPPRQDYDAVLKNATHKCRYVLKTLDNGDGTWVVTNVDGYSATIAEEMLSEEPRHWGISVPIGTTFPQAVNPDSPEPIFVRVKADDTTEEEEEEDDDDDKLRLDSDNADDDNGPGAFVDDKALASGNNDNGNAMGQCGIDGVTGVLIALRNALAVVNIKIRCMPPDADNTQAIELSATLERHIREAKTWLTDMERRFPSSSPLDKPPTRSSFLGFLSGLGPMAAICATLGVCLFVKRADASTVPSTILAGSNSISMIDSPAVGLAPFMKIGSNLAQYLVANSDPSPSRKRAFDETELEAEGESLSRRSKTKR